MSWVYDHYKYFYPHSVGIDFSRQNQTKILTTKADPHTVRVKVDPRTERIANL